MASSPKNFAFLDTRVRVRQFWHDAFWSTNRTSIVEWAEHYIKDIPYSPTAGKFRVANMPMIKEVMEAIVDPHTRSMVSIASVQSGKTLAHEIALAYLIATEPGSAIWLDTVDTQAKDEGENRLRPLFEKIAPVRAVFNPDRNKMRNATMIFTNGMTLWVLGAKNKRNLQRRSIRYIFGDETWLWEKDRMAEAEARTTAFRAGKCIFMSQGSFENDDTDKKFQSSSQGEWSFVCPECGTVQPFDWHNLHWERKNREILNVRLQCTNCQHEFADNDETRRLLNSSAKFVHKYPDEVANRGFHWNALSNPKTDWISLVREYLLAKESARRGDVSSLQVFYQKRLALAWRDDREDDELLAPSTPIGDYEIAVENNAQHYEWDKEACFSPEARKAVPKDLVAGQANIHPLRFLTVDVQEGYFYFVVRGWAIDGSSRLLDYGMLQFIDDIAKKATEHNIFHRFVFIDCGFDTDRILQFCSTHDFTALRGSVKNEWTFRNRGFQYIRYYSPMESVRCGNGRIARRHYFSNLRCKDILATLRSGRASATWEIPANAQANYIKQLNSEERNPKTQRWEQIARRPNHFFDCESMQICGALMLGIVGLQKDEGAQ